MKLDRVDVDVRLEPGEVPDFCGPHSTKAIRPTVVKLAFVPPRAYGAGRSANVGGMQLKRDGTPGQVFAERWPGSDDETLWPEWLTEIADRYQPDWEKEGY